MIYIIFFIFLIIGGIVVKGNKPYAYLVAVMLFLWLLIGLRDITIGPDTPSYVSDFRNFSSLDFSRMIDKLSKEKEPGYLFISWLPSCISTNYTVFLLTWALFPVVSFFTIFKNDIKGAVDYLIAILVFFLLGLFAFYVAGIRQTAALSLTMIAYKYFKEIQFKPFFNHKNLQQVIAFALIIGMAYTIHNSVLIFLVAFFVKNVKVRWWYILIPIGLFFISDVVKIDQVVLISKLLFADRFSIYGAVYESSQNTSAFIMQFALFLICFINKDRLIRSDKSNQILFNFVVLGIIFQSLCGLLAEFARISFYFSMFYMILVPRSMKMMPKRVKYITYIGFVLIALLYLFFITSTNLPEYKFS